MTDKVIMFCIKCNYETEPFERMDNRAYSKAVAKLQEHMKKKHPRVKFFYKNIDWRNCISKEAS